MRRKLIAAATAAVLTVFAGEASAAKPIDYAGKGCLYRTYFNPSFTYAQTFKANFSVLRWARFVLFEVAPADDDVTFVVNLRSSGGIIATSLGGVLAAGTSYDDAVAGDAVTFTFERGAEVTPGQSYTLELVRVNGDSPVWACEVRDWPAQGYVDGYADGYFLWNGNMQAEYDLEFAVKGTGPPK